LIFLNIPREVSFGNTVLGSGSQKISSPRVRILKSKSPLDSLRSSIPFIETYDIISISRSIMNGALFLKRPFDVGLSFFGIILSIPLWLTVPFLIMIEDGRPIFYKQERVGRNGRIFSALKFRSMIKGAEAKEGPIQASENDPRVTKVGKILRATAMDELPQLINIFKGDMSFVGPRALRPEEKEAISPSNMKSLSEFPGYRERHSIRPGLTGIAQIYLPPDAPRQKKFRMDLFYIKKRNFLWDLKLIFLSFWITFRGKWQSRKPKI
jgi:lipopolysaccharide/colanic/teichoic acid biosynthesis glycosyltransferase